MSTNNPSFSFTAPYKSSPSDTKSPLPAEASITYRICFALATSFIAFLALAIIGTNLLLLYVNNESFEFVSLL